MAHDSSHTPAGRVSEATIDAVRIALRSYLANGGDEPALCATLTAMSAEARDRGVRAEQLLVVLKEMWSALPEVRAMNESSEQLRLLQRVVTMCIKEYYSG